ncbi:MAG: SAM-dependent methyltransferase, partial [Spirochaetales bacterium]|nr:SAM-dependent methyltransferase [Spirochaetales bacterium]
DSRGIRFHEKDRSVVFYELETPLTQNAKISQYRKRKIVSPDTVKYIPIDFTKESIESKLMANGYDIHKKTLFIMEGIAMYLDEDSLQKTILSIKRLSKTGNFLVFDFVYKSVLWQEKRYYGEEDIYGRVSKYNEAWQSGIEEDNIGPSLKKLGLKLIRQYDTLQLEKEYHLEKRRVNGTHCIVLTEISAEQAG